MAYDFILRPVPEGRQGSIATMQQTCFSSYIEATWLTKLHPFSPFHRGT